MLSHPNIIRIYDLYEAPDELPFISMEYVDGPSLWALRSQHPKNTFSGRFSNPLSSNCAARSITPTGEKVIHRDLKPANMLLDDRKRLRLSDFGIAARGHRNLRRHHRTISQQRHARLHEPATD